MKSLLLLFSAAALLLVSCGCSCVSTIERANLVPVCSREEYIRLHPESVHNDCIKNGEIVRGMSAHEVVASWGVPNVYIVARAVPSEQWIYYVRDRNSLVMLIYTLSFTEDTLKTWNVDQKRFVGQEIVSSSESLELPVGSTRELKKK